MVTVNRQSLIYVLAISLPSLLFEPCRDLTDAVTTHLFSSNIVAVYSSGVRGVQMHPLLKGCLHVYLVSLRKRNYVHYGPH